MTRRARAALRRAVAAGAVAALTACGGGGESTGPETPVADRITVSDSAVTMQAGFSHYVTATLRTADGQAIAGQVAWSSSNDAVAIVTQGLIEARGVGTATVRASASGKSASIPVTVIPPIVASVQLSRSRAVLPPDRTLTVVAHALDSRGQVIPGRPAAFTSSRPDVAVVSYDGVVTTVGVGEAVIHAVIEDRQETLGVLVGLPQALAIPTIAALPGAAPGGLEYTLAIRHQDDSVTMRRSIGSWGALTGAIVLAPQVEYTARADGGAMLPARMTAPKAYMPASVPVVFVPMQVTLDAGTAIGTHYISLEAALAPCNTPGPQCLSGFYGMFARGVQRWERYPVIVSVDPAVDTAAVWRALETLEQAFGKKMFARNDGTLPVGIDVRAGSPPGAGNAGGYATWVWNARDQITSATVWLRTTATPYLVHHEFLHALGFGHTCAWPSVMGGYGCPPAPTVTAQDVAYVVLASRIHDAERAFRLPASGMLPCGTMSIWAARPEGTSVTCAGDESAWLDDTGGRMARVPVEPVRRAEMP